MVDLDPLFTTSPRSAGDLLLISPISSAEFLLCASPDAHSRTDEASASVVSGLDSPATSISITNRTGEPQLMTPPLIPLPAMINVQTDPALLLQLTEAYRESNSLHRSLHWSPRPIHSGLSREGTFDALAEPAAIRDHPMISDQRDGYPYRVTSYRDDDYSNLNSPFAMQYTTPGFSSGWVHQSRLAC